MILWNPGLFTMPATEVRALVGVRELFVRFDCRVDEPAMLRPRPAGAPVTEHEHVLLDLMPRNDPTDRWRIAGTFAAGAVQITRSRVINGEASLGACHDVWQKIFPGGSAGHDIRSFFGADRDRWWMEWGVGQAHVRKQ